MTTDELKALVRDVPDFPVEGIVFKDLMPLIGHAEAFRSTIEHLAEWARPRDPDIILGAEARGFIFGAGVAIALGVGFIPVRKKGKLPGETIGQNYALEYGVDTIEIHADVLDAGDKVLLVDDLHLLGIDQVEGILFDLGVSSMQLDEVDRGFSYSKDAPLDMRMDDTAEFTAAEIIATYSEADLRRIFREYGEEKLADRYARKIVAAREDGPTLRVSGMVLFGGIGVMSRDPQVEASATV